MRAADVALQLASMFPHRFYLELQRAGRADDEAHVIGCRATGRAAQAAGGGHPSGAVHHPGRLRGARGARVHFRRRNPGQPAAGAPVHPRAVLQERGADGGPVRRCAVRPRQHAGDRAALQPDAGAGQAAAAQLPDSAGERRDRMSVEDYFRHVSTRGWRSGSGSCTRMRPSASASARVYRGAAGVRDHHDPEDGLSRLLPDRRRLHQVGQDQRLPGGAGARLRCRLAGGVFAEDHRPGPAAIQAAVRALPEPRAGVDARLRHRLLPDQPQPGDRLRQGQVRQGCGEPDRHLRHHGCARRHPRRGPGAGHELHLLRRHQQTDSEQAGHAHHD